MGPSRWFSREEVESYDGAITGSSCPPPYGLPLSGLLDEARLLGTKSAKSSSPAMLQGRDKELVDCLLLVCDIGWLVMEGWFAPLVCKKLFGMGL